MFLRAPVLADRRGTLPTLSLVYDFTVTPGTLPAGVTHTRAVGTGLPTYVDSSGVVQTESGANTPLWHYDIETLDFIGVLAMARRTALWPYSEDLETDTTVGGATTIVPTQGDPAGGTAAQRVQYAGNVDGTFIRKDLSGVQANQRLWFTAFMKPFVAGPAQQSVVFFRDSASNDYTSTERSFALSWKAVAQKMEVSTDTAISVFLDNKDQIASDLVVAFPQAWQGKGSGTYIARTGTAAAVCEADSFVFGSIPDGVWDITIEAGSKLGAAYKTYHLSKITTSGGAGWTFAWSAAAQLAGEFAIRKVSFARHIPAAPTPVGPGIHVDPSSGNDSNDGFSAATAKLTIEAAITAAEATTDRRTVWLHEGFYEFATEMGGPGTITLNGKTDLNIFAVPGEAVIASGGEKLTGFSDNGDGTYSVSTAETSPTVSVGGKRYRSATAAAFNPNDPWRSGWNFTSTVTGTTWELGYMSADASVINQAAGKGGIYCTCGHTNGGTANVDQWMPAPRKVASINTGSRRIRMTQQARYKQDRGPFRLHNYAGWINLPGDHGYDSSTGKFTLYPRTDQTDTFETDGVRVARLKKAFRLVGCTRVYISGIVFQDFEFDYEARFYNETSGNGQHAIRVADAATIELNGSAVCGVTKNWFRACSTPVLLVNSSDNLIAGNEMDDIGFSGVLLARDVDIGSSTNHSHRNRIFGNRMTGVGVIFPWSAAVLGLGGNDNDIGFNDISECARYAISLNSFGNSDFNALGGSAYTGFFDNIIRNNYCLNMALATSDCGGIHHLGRAANTNCNATRDQHRTLIKWNWVENVEGWQVSPSNPLAGWQDTFSLHKAAAFYMDDGASALDIYGNVAIGSPWDSWFLHGGENCLIRNNISIQPSGRGAVRNESTGSHHPRNNRVTGNIFVKEISGSQNYHTTNSYGCVGGSIPAQYLNDNILHHVNRATNFNSANDNQSIIADPLFVDQAGRDLRLQANSPAYQKGWQDIPYDKIGRDGFDAAEIALLPNGWDSGYPTWPTFTDPEGLVGETDDTVYCLVTGTGGDGLDEDEIIAGGKTLILTLVGDTWAATVGANNAITTALVAGIDGSGSGAGSFDNEIGLAYTDVARTSDTVVTVTLPAAAAYGLGTNETITITVPATALVTSASAVSANRTVTISANVSATAFTDLVTADSPDLYYRLDETSGTTIADDSGNSNTGTFVAGHTLNQDGLVGDGNAAVSFSGALNSHALVADSQIDFLDGATAATWVFLLKPTGLDSTSRGILLRRVAYQDAECFGIFMDQTDMTIRMPTYDTGQSFAHGMSSGNTYLVIVRYDAAEAAANRVNVRIALAGQTSWLKDQDLNFTATALPTETAPMYVMAFGANRSDNQGGVLDELAIFASALTDARCDQYRDAVDVAATVGWDPSQLSDLELWLDANDAGSITESSGNVSQWDDASGNAYHAVQGTGADQPNWSATGWAAGLGGITFNGSSDHLDLDSGLYGVPNGDNFVMLVFKTSSASDQRVLSGTTAGTRWGVNVNVTGSNLGVVNDTSFNQVYTGSLSFSGGIIAGFTRSGATIQTYANGTAGTSGSAANQIITALTLGNYDLGPSAHFNGVLAEVVVCSSVPSTLNRQKLEGYYAHKWSLAGLLDVSHPYKSAAP